MSLQKSIIVEKCTEMHWKCLSESLVNPKQLSLLILLNWQTTHQLRCTAAIKSSIFLQLSSWCDQIINFSTTFFMMQIFRVHHSWIKRSRNCYHNWRNHGQGTLWEEIWFAQQCWISITGWKKNPRVMIAWKPFLLGANQKTLNAVVH